MYTAISYQIDTADLTFQRTGESLNSRLAVYRHFMHMANPDAKDMDSLVDTKIASERDLWERMTFYGAFRGKDLIGTIACTADDVHAGIPFERGHSHPFDLTEIRQHGKVLEISLFSVGNGYAGSRDVLSGLFSCVIAHAEREGIAFLGTQSAENRLAMYQKIGFVAMTARPVLKAVTQFPVIPAIYNFARDLVDGNSRTSSFIAALMGEPRRITSVPIYESAALLSDDAMLALVGRAHE
ncbi:hypothetical protein [uncultured Herbaspirillum sp.]|uniref:hypothetical protein n=1 Tax=uncultured Herbaspirillum sp. TaxID=160236 RepID=UPI00258B875A|nr:hypothetical protein [uncultured Herbaspirillum sp.]